MREPDNFFPSKRQYEREKKEKKHVAELLFSHSLLNDGSPVLMHSVRQTNKKERRKKNVHPAKKKDSSRAIPIKRNSSLSYVCVCPGRKKLFNILWNSLVAYIYPPSPIPIFLNLF
jgi:hypothetical protein